MLLYQYNIINLIRRFIQIKYSQIMSIVEIVIIIKQIQLLGIYYNNWVINMHLIFYFIQLLLYT